MTRTDSRSRRPSDLAIAGSAAVCLAGAFAIPPESIEDGPVVCPFRLLTGLPCPGCGLSRSWVALAHGDVDTAFARHPFGPLLFGAAVVAVVVVALRRSPIDLARVAGSRPAIALAAVWCTTWLVGLLA